MFGNLVESGRRGRRGRGAGVVSVAAHAAVVMGAVVATQRAATASDAGVGAADTMPVFVEPATRRAEAAGVAARGAAASAAAVVPAPAAVPSGVPPVALGEVPAVPAMVGAPDALAAVLGEVGRAAPGDLDAVVGAVREAGEVEEPLRVLEDAMPRYPEALQRAGIAGRVTLEFVVDTLGRVEPGSVVVIATPSEALVPLARESILATRFTPARAGGGAVRVRARREVVFKAEGR